MFALGFFFFGIAVHHLVLRREAPEESREPIWRLRAALRPIREILPK